MRTFRRRLGVPSGCDDRGSATVWMIGVTVAADTVTVSVTTTARLQMLQVVGGDTVTFDATATAQAIKIEQP